MREINGIPIATLLRAEGEEQQQLFAHARRVRTDAFGHGAAMRGIIEVTNHCAKNCDYCAMRSSNRGLGRYRMSAGEIMSAAISIRDCGIPTVLIQGGQDDLIDGVVEEAVRRIRKETGLFVILCLGERGGEQYARFKESGAGGYILKFETSDPGLFETVTHSSHIRRVECARMLRKLGFQVGIGNIVGLPGQTAVSLVHDLFHAKNFGPEFVSCAPFIPNENTPFEAETSGDLNLTLNTIALWRILLKDAHIPAVSALGKLHPQGQYLGLKAGANVVTVNFTPEPYRSKYLIYSRRRIIVSLEHAQATIRAAGLEPGP
jgi:biotin synthase